MILRTPPGRMIFLLAVGGFLWWLDAVHPTAAPAWAPWDFSPVEYLATTLGIGWYARGVLRTAPAARPTWWRHACYGIGVLSIYAVLQTRFEYDAQHEFFINRIQHIFMHHLGPFLIALAWPGAMLHRGMPVMVRRAVESRPARRLVRIIQQPLLAAVLFVGLIYLFLIPAVQFRAMIDPRLYDVMNWSMVVDGILFWCLVLDPRPKPDARLGYGARMALPFFVMFPQISVGAYIAFSPVDLYPYYDLCGRLFPSITALNDQHIGGIVAWIPAGMMSAIAFMMVLNALRVHEDSLTPAWMEGNTDDALFAHIDSSAWTGR